MICLLIRESTRAPCTSRRGAMRAGDRDTGGTPRDRQPGRPTDAVGCPVSPDTPRRSVTYASKLMSIRRVSSRTVYANQWMRVREDEVERADGSNGIYGVVEKPDFALIVPVDTDCGLWLVEQYRYPVEGRFWEFPQGSWEQQPGVDPAVLARGELREEAGLEASSLERHVEHQLRGRRARIQVQLEQLPAGCRHRHEDRVRTRKNRSWPVDGQRFRLEQSHAVASIDCVCAARPRNLSSEPAVVPEHRALRFAVTDYARTPSCSSSRRLSRSGCSRCTKWPACGTIARRYSPSK
jgi:8-oxo-dGTP pyrophosphatase MutT (NUDIX family)